ncbi:hypothetical protein OP10G_3143 [Fimbriimonas ginsengisoli Gsoil 348]|uniref:Uncharacterized protein n=2 Tax=Fimbriimonas ginsengisoli TaxID=1005039 RepID=A0A068NSV7_FIMGI|nr:hypothetical protein OP10G_3143 [Fimbriimonas ginsengisoli Gsoil 348]
MFAIGLVAPLLGCGGSRESGGDLPGLADPFTVYSAQLPDGAQMDLVLAETSGGEWSGSFNEASDDNAAEDVSGLFSGTRAGNSVTADILTDGGVKISLSGSYQSDGTIRLTRSDLPGSTLVFHTVKANSAAATRSSVQFSIKFPNSSPSTIAVDSTPTRTDTHFTYYLGVVDQTTGKVSISIRNVQPLAMIYMAQPNYTSLQSEQPVTSLNELVTKSATSTKGLGQFYKIQFQTGGVTTGPP